MNSRPSKTTTRTKSATRFCHLLLIVSAAFAVNTSALGQPTFLTQPEDQTVNPDQRWVIREDISLEPNNPFGELISERAYRGAHPDTSDPLPDSVLPMREER